MTIEKRNFIIKFVKIFKIIEARKIFWDFFKFLGFLKFYKSQNDLNTRFDLREKFSTIEKRNFIIKFVKIFKIIEAVKFSRIFLNFVNRTTIRTRFDSIFEANFWIRNGAETLSLNSSRHNSKFTQPSKLSKSTRSRLLSNFVQNSRNGTRARD